MFLGGRESIKVVANVKKPIVTGSIVEVELADSSGISIVISKGEKKPQIIISKEGYETQKFTLTRSKRQGVTTLSALSIGLGASGIMTGALLESTSRSMANSGLSGTNTPQQVFNATPLYVIGGIMILSGIIDFASHASCTFSYKQLEFDMVPVPSNATNVESIACSSVNFKIQPGKQIGTVYRSKNGVFESEKNNNWEETANIAVEELEVQVNNDLGFFGYPVPGLKNKFKEDNQKARYFINAEVQNIRLDQYINSNYSPVDNQVRTGNLILMTSSVDSHCGTVILWSIYDNLKRKVVLEKEIKSAVWGNDESFKSLTFKSVNGSLKKLLSDTSFTELIKKKAEVLKAEIITDSINISAIKPAEKLGEIIESAITIELGNSHGSGFIISKEGYALTNYHVVGDEKSVDVILSNGISLKGEVIRTNETRDLALVKLSGKGFKPVAINLGNILVGESVIAVGTPGKIELGQSLSKGIVSGKREIEGLVFIQTDVSISPGNSGGPLFNEKNEVIGIITSKLMGNGIDGIGFAIPILNALTVLGIQIK